MPAAITNSCEDMAVSPLVKETVIIFDWDDTLLASSFLASKGYNRLDEALNRTNDVDAQLKELEQAVIALLTMALSYGHVNIITNAETGWVQLSAQTFIPAVLPILDRVCISSARSTYEPIFPQSPLQWKFCAFHDKVVNSFMDSANLERNVVSFGDSRVEREAVLSVTRNLPRTRCKSIKFAERPTLEQLRLQLELVSRCFPQIYQHDGDLDLQLTVLTDTPSPVSPGPSRPSTPTPPTIGPALSPPAPQANAGAASSNSTSAEGQQAAAAGLGPVMMEAEPLPAIPPAVASCITGQRVRVSGFQAALAPPLAVACGANSSLVIDSNGAASVVPSNAAAANVAAATAMLCASKVLGDNGVNHEREVTVLAS